MTPQGSIMAVSVALVAVVHSIFGSLGIGKEEMGRLCVVIQNFYLQIYLYDFFFFRIYRCHDRSLYPLLRMRAQGNYRIGEYGTRCHSRISG